MGFPDSSVGKESACNAGDPGLIPGLGRSPREGIGYWLQYSWSFLVAQLVKNPPARQETLVRSLGWEDPLEKGKATHSGILAWRIPWTVCDHGVAKSQTRLSYFHFSSLHAQNMSLCPLRKSPRPSLPDYSPVPGHVLRNVSYLLGFSSTSPYPFLGSVSLSVVSNSL